MGRNPAAGSQNTFGGNHAAQILGRGFDADEEDFFALLSRDDGAISVEVDLASGSAGAGG